MLLSFANQKNIDFVDPRGTGAERHFKRGLQPTPSNPASAPEHIYIYIYTCTYLSSLSFSTYIPNAQLIFWNFKHCPSIGKTELIGRTGSSRFWKQTLYNYTSPSAALLCQNFDRPQYGIERKGLKFNIQISELVSLGKKWLGFKSWLRRRIEQFFGKWELAELVQNSWWRVWTNQVAEHLELKFQMWQEMDCN